LLRNDRDYTNVVNQRKVVDGASRAAFRPSELINTNPDATSGPIVTDAHGQVLGGNGRKMILDRVYSGNAEGAAAYRALLKSQAEHFGLDPAAVDAMKQPVLVREIGDSELSGPNAKQNAVTNFNKKGTADLTPGERAIADSRRVSNDTLDDMAARLDAQGPKATVADVLEGQPGREVLNKLIADGVIAPQEQAALTTKDGLTKAGRDRVSQLMIGRYFSDAAQMDSIPLSVRAKVERLAAPLAQVEAKGEWNLTPDVQAAIGLVDDAKRAGVASIDDYIHQQGFFGKDEYSPNAVTLAKAMKTAKSTELTAAARQYAQDAAYAAKGTQTLMGDAPTPAESFADSFGKLKSGAQSDAAALMKKKPIGEMARLPEISERRDAEFKPDSTTRFHIGRSAFEPIELDNKDADVIPHTSAHVANSHLIEFLGRAVGRPLNDAWHKVGAFHFPPEQLSDLHLAIEDEAQKSTAASAPVIAKLKQTIQNAQQNDQSLVFSKDHASLPPELRPAVFDQELNHVRQRLLGPTAEHLGDSAASFVSSPIGMKAKATLEKTLEYSFKNDHLAALEIGERLMRPGGYEELGISGAERDALAEQYMRSLKKEYGDKAQNVIDRIRKASRP
jgi:hypothetical protein